MNHRFHCLPREVTRTRMPVTTTRKQFASSRSSWAIGTSAQRWSRSSTIILASRARSSRSGRSALKARLSSSPSPAANSPSLPRSPGDGSQTSALSGSCGPSMLMVQPLCRRPTTTAPVKTEKLQPGVREMSGHSRQRTVRGASRSRGKRVGPIGGPSSQGWLKIVRQVVAPQRA